MVIIVPTDSCARSISPARGRLWGRRRWHRGRCRRCRSSSAGFHCCMNWGWCCHRRVDSRGWHTRGNVETRRRSSKTLAKTLKPKIGHFRQRKNAGFSLCRFGSLLETKTNSKRYSVCTRYTKQHSTEKSVQKTKASDYTLISRNIVRFYPNNAFQRSSCYVLLLRRTAKQNNV